MNIFHPGAETLELLLMTSEMRIVAGYLLFQPFLRSALAFFLSKTDVKGRRQHQKRFHNVVNVDDDDDVNEDNVNDVIPSHRVASFRRHSGDRLAVREALPR